MAATIDLSSGSNFLLEHFLHLHTLYHPCVKPVEMGKALHLGAQDVQTISARVREYADFDFLGKFLVNGRTLMETWTLSEAKKNGLPGSGVGALAFNCF